MRRILSKPIVVFHAFLLGLAVLVAQQTPPGGEQDPNAQDPGAGAAIAQSGLLPIYGMTLELQKDWVDGKKFPSANPNGGISDVFQQLFDSQIATCGFNVIRVPFDINDGKAEESNKLANLLVWAQARGIKIAPVLIGAPAGKPFPKDYATRSRTYVNTVLGLLKKNNSQHLGAWGQVAYLQLGYPLNHAGYHGVVDPAAAADAMTKAAANIRTAETTALGESGLSPSSIMVGASLDFELLKTGAIAGTELSDESFTQSYEALKNYLSLFAESPEIGMVSIEWFPGSISSDATEKLPDLVRALLADVQGKLLVISTGYSTAFKPSEDQSRYYALSFANLADLRAAEGVECAFTGVIWNTGVDGGDANAAPPSEETPNNMAAWDLSAKASELVAMLQNGGGDADLQWWWKKTRSSFGILSASEGVFTPKQAHEVLVELQGATAQAAVDTGAAEAAAKLEDAQIQAQTQGDPNAAGAPPVDPNTGLPIDPNTGLPIDPNTGQPINQAQPTIDPNTGLPIDPNTGLPIDPNATGGVAGANPVAGVVDSLKGQLNTALSELLGSIIERGKSGLSNLIGKFLGDAGVGTPGFDPNAGAGGGFPTDPNTGLPIDPNTGLPIDPNTGLPIDPNTGLPVGGDPGRTGGETGTGGTGGTGGAGGGADLAFGSPVSAPTSLTTGEAVAIEVQLRNNGTGTAQGATAYLVDGEGNAFAASDMTTVEPGASVTATITFVPPSAGAIGGAKVLLFCDNETNPADNENPLGSLNVSDPPGGVDEGIAPTDPSDPGTGGTGGTGGGGIGGTGGGRPGGLLGGKGGLLGGLKGGLLGALKPKLGAAIRMPGIAPKLSLITPGLFNVGALTPGTSAKLMTEKDDDDPGLANGDEQGLRRPMIGFQPGQSIPLNIPITNPFKRGFKNVKATLFVNGQQIAMRNLGAMMPKQTRTVSFGEFKPTSSGRFPTEVRFEAIGPKNRLMRGRAAGEINVANPMKARALVRPTMMPSAGAIKEGGLKSMPRPVFGLVPTMVKTSILRPTLSPTIGTLRPTTGGVRPPAISPTRPFSVPVIKTLSFSSKAAVGLVSDDIGLMPFPPTEGSQVAVTVKLQNRGMAAARAIKVEAFADGKSLKSQTLDVPAGQQAVATKFDKFAATLGNHVVKVVITVDGAPQEASRTFEVKKGVLVMRPALTFIKTASLSFTGNDIQLSPTPQPSQPTNLSLNVRNPAAVPVNNAEFEAFADGRSLGKVRQTIGALQSATIAGFPAWTPPAGTHTLKVVASIAGRQIAAEKAVNVTQTLAIRPTIIRPTLIRPGTTLIPAGTTPGRSTTPGGTTPPRTTPIITRPGVLTNPGTIIRPGASAVDLGVSVEGISFLPAAPQPEQDVTIQVQIRNFGTQEAVGATLTIGYRVDNQAMKTMNLPVNVKPNEQIARSWRVKLPKGTQLQVSAQVAHKDDKNAANGSATKTQSLTGATRPIITNPGTTIRPPITNPGTTRPGVLTNPGLLVAPKPDMAMTNADITFLPSSVKAGDTLTFTVRVRNSGQGEAKGARLSLALSKDGARHDAKTFDFDAKPGETVTRVYSVQVPASKQLRLDANVTHANDASAANASATATVNVTQPLPLLTRPGALLPGPGT
ncbi:MAG TPA: CARDB domain-containing protein, partial [Fimbriimonadaceae bacterium]|nr:CARDB domain-containing protein [Fimbriimonadaceae bacterium]